MATKEMYDTCIEVLNRFINLITETGSITGIAYAFSPRKVQIDYLSKGIGIIIRKDKVFVVSNSDINKNHGSLERVFSESESFQRSCNNEYFCDKGIEDLISQAFELYSLYVKDSLMVGYWEES